MRSEFKRLFMGFIYSLMTFSFIMAPIPVINTAFAEGESYDYTNGSGRKKIYKKGKNFDDTREKASFKTYAEEHGGLENFIQQVIVGMMSVTLLNALKFKYTYEADKKLYGNDCDSNNTAKMTVRAAQLGSLLYLLGDISANYKYAKSARLAAEEFEKTGWTPEQKKDFENMSDEEKEALDENDKATDAAKEQDVTLKGFNTMIGLLKDKEKALKRKKGFATAASLAYGLSTLFELIKMIQCQMKCSTEWTEKAYKAGTQSAAFTAAIGAAATAGIAAGATVAGAPIAAACATLGTTLGTYAASIGAQVGKDQAEALAKLAATTAADEARKADALKDLAMAKSWLESDHTDGAMKAAAKGISQKINSSMDAIKKAQDVENAAGQVKFNIISTKDKAAYSPLVVNAMTCAAAGPPVLTTTGAALREYSEYAYRKVQCCGAPGVGSAAEAAALISKEILLKQIMILDQGIAEANRLKEIAIEEAKKAAIDEAKEKVKEKALKEIASKFAETFSPELRALAKTVTDIAANQQAEKGLDVKMSSGSGTYLMMGVPTAPGVFYKRDDIVLESLFGKKETSSLDDSLIKHPEDGILPSELFNFDESNKEFVKMSFESNIRRLADKTYLSKEFTGARDEAIYLIEQEKQINNIMFFFNQVIDETSPNGFANLSYQKHRYWNMITNMISNLIFPKAHAFLSGLGGGQAAGLAIRVIAPMLGLPEEWTQVLNITSSIFMSQGFVASFIKKYGLVKPLGRTITWTVSTIVLGMVISWENKAIDEVKKRKKAVEDEMNKWLASAPAHNKLAGDDRERNKYSSTDYESRSRNSTSSFIQKCAVPSGNGFKPANCPQASTNSSFDLGKADPVASKGLIPDHLKGMSTISSLSSKTSNGSLKEGDLSGSNLAELERMNRAIAAYNNKLIKAIDTAEKNSAKKQNRKSLPLSSMLAKARNAIGGSPTAIQGSALGGNAMASTPSFGSRSENKEEESGVVEATTGGAGGGAGAVAAVAPSFDLDLLGDDMGGVSDDGSVADGMGAESEKKEKNLADFEINHDDINKKKEVSIFKILSNRYILSYPKVLEEEVINEQKAPEAEVKKE